MKVAILLILILAATVSGGIVHTGQVSIDLKNSRTNAISGMIPVAKSYYASQTVTASSLNKPVHSPGTKQTWDYQGSCIEKDGKAHLKTTRISCTVSSNDRQMNTWSCASPQYLRCVGHSCPRATCRMNGLRVS